MPNEDVFIVEFFRTVIDEKEKKKSVGKRYKILISPNIND